MWIKCKMKSQVVFLKATGITMEEDNPTQYSIIATCSDRDFAGVVVKRFKSLDTAIKILKDIEIAIVNGESMVDLSS